MSWQTAKQSEDMLSPSGPLSDSDRGQGFTAALGNQKVVDNSRTFVV